jgi:hypothetical protein
MKEIEEKLEMKVKDCYNTNTIFDKRKYVLLSDAKKILNEALSIANVVGRSEQYFCCKEQINQRCSEQCLGCFQFENKG